MKSIITQKYQVHIPAAVRRVVGLTPNARVTVRAEGKRVIIESDTSSVLDLAGSFKVKHPIPAEDIRKHLTYGEKK
jgi:AbrB family looped-hinge helix DNA binding protein